MQFNNIGNALNCKNKFSKDEFNTPLIENNYLTMQMHAKNFEQYITSLCNETGTSILNTNRKTGFLRLIICLRNIFPWFQKLKPLQISYLLTYKLSQDYLEIFFSSIRDCGGFNNNSNALQLKSAYKRLLIHNEFREFKNGNCLFDRIEILHVSSQPKNLICSIGDAKNFNEIIALDHQYVASLLDLISYVDNITQYIAEFISYKLQRIINYYMCKNQLIGTEMPLLSKLKNEGP